MLDVVAVLHEDLALLVEQHVGHAGVLDATLTIGDESPVRVGLHMVKRARGSRECYVGSRNTFNIRVETASCEGVSRPLDITSTDRDLPQLSEQRHVAGGHVRNEFLKIFTD